VKYLSLVFRYLRRRRRIRTGLTTASIAVAFFLFGLLMAIENALNAGVDIAGADRLVVRNKTSLIMPLPLAYQERLRQIDGVSEATFATWFGGIYQDERNFFPQFAVDTETYRRVFPEFAIPDDQWQAFLADREGAVVGRSTAERFGWELGDRIPIQGTIWTGTWDFNIRAIYDGTRAGDDETQFWFQWKYLEERRQTSFGGGTVGWYTVQIDDPDVAAAISKVIDERFANSAWETATETEQAFAAGFAKQIGNIRLLMLSIGSVVLFTLLLVAGNTMAMAVRERIPELGIMKALGFGDTTILMLVLVESMVVASIGGFLGLWLAKGMADAGDPTGGMLPLFHLSSSDLALGAAMVVAVGLVAGLIPAFSARNLRIVDALRRV
jgi:putative ABC transport system permease protein